MKPEHPAVIIRRETNTRPCLICRKPINSPDMHLGFCAACLAALHRRK